MADRPMGEQLFTDERGAWLQLQYGRVGRYTRAHQENTGSLETRASSDLPYPTLLSLSLSIFIYSIHPEQRISSIQSRLDSKFFAGFEEKKKKCRFKIIKKNV